METARLQRRSLAAWLRILSISALLAGGAGCSKDENKPAVSEGVADATLYVKCTSCGEGRKVSLQEMTKLFPPAGLEMSTTRATCARCQKAAVERAVRCPKDGTIYTLKQAREVSFEPCPACGWTQADALRKGSATR